MFLPLNYLLFHLFHQKKINFYNLIQTPSPSGYEETIKSVVRDYVKDFAADVRVDLCLAKDEREFNDLRDDTIRRLIALGEPEVFTAYKQLWDAAADVIVPLVREAQIANGVQPYTPEQYKNHGAGTEEIAP